MTHYNRDYGNMSDAEKRAKAIEDIKDYLGEARFAKVDPDMAKLSCHHFQMCCSLFIGVEGYPVLAWYESHHGIGSYSRDWDKEAAEKGLTQMSDGTHLVDMASY